MTALELPAVVRVHASDGSHIEPDLDPAWDEPTKLAWQAAVVAHDTGLRIEVHDMPLLDQDGYPIPGTHSYGVVVGTSGHSGVPFRSAWRYLNGVSVGAEQASRRDEARADWAKVAIERVRSLAGEALQAWEPEHEYHLERARRKGYGQNEVAAEVYGDAIKALTGIQAALDQQGQDGPAADNRGEVPG